MDTRKNRFHTPKPIIIKWADKIINGLHAFWNMIGSWTVLAFIIGTLLLSIIFN